MQEVARRKGLAAVLDRAVVTDTAGTVIDLDELVPQNEEPSLADLVAQASEAEAADTESAEDEAADTEAEAETADKA